jgi:gamma-glutamyltranspeptidase/glutathione hydrolase
MVVSEHALASAAGARILLRGGNAADAGIATALALAVVYPQAGNLGGGGFALYVPHSDEALALDFRETAPGTTDPSLYLDANGHVVPERSRSGPFSVGVPGTPAGLWMLWQRCGSREIAFAELAAPAIELARKGFQVDERLARALESREVRARFAQSPAAMALFYPGGVPRAVGDTLVQTALAATLEAYARDGPPAFYSGSVARSIASELTRAADVDGVPGDPRQNSRGLVSVEDLRGYEPLWREPLRAWFRGMEVLSMPPPSSGGVLLMQTLAILDGFPLETERRAALAERALAPNAPLPTDADRGGINERIVHWWIEALRLGFAARARSLGDPDFTPVPVWELLAPQSIARERIAIGERARNDLPLEEVASEGSQTTHLSVVDSRGNALSLTTTLNSTFGSGLMVDAGFLLNNELDDFAIQTGAPNLYGLVGGEANAIAPRKRPLSSMTPTVLREGGHSVAFVLGSPGGPRIITSVIAVLLRTLVFDESLEEAVRAPRFHQQWNPPATEFEPRWPSDLLEGLRRRGHVIVERDDTWGSVQAIRVMPNGEVVGVTDPRNPGAAVASKR